MFIFKINIRFFLLFIFSVSLSLFNFYSCKSLKLNNASKSIVDKNNNVSDDYTTTDDEDDTNDSDSDNDSDSSSTSDNECVTTSGTVDSDICEIEHIIIEKLNEYRSSKSLSTLKNNKALSCAARINSQNQAKSRSAHHDGGKRWKNKRLSQIRSCASDNSEISDLSAENVGQTVNYSFSSNEDAAKTFMDIWKKSLEHNANMLNNNSTYIGVGVVKSGYDWYATQIFGK